MPNENETYNHCVCSAVIKYTFHSDEKWTSTLWIIPAKTHKRCDKGKSLDRDHPTLKINQESVRVKQPE